MSAPAAAVPAVFVTGSTFRHVAVMTATSAVGLMAIFAVDLLLLIYVSWLGRPEATAGIGYATIVLFLLISVNVGLMIAVGALTARALGAGNRSGARRIAGASLALLAIAGFAISALLLPLLAPFLSLLGAHGESHAVALSFLQIVLPSNAVLAIGMGLSGILRAVGDARRAMYVTLGGGVATALLDPLFIFALGLGTNGAAIVLVLSRLILLAIGLHGVVTVHDMLERPDRASIKETTPAVVAIAGPAILSNLATPIANAVFASVFARFGDGAMAALAIIDRVSPVAFGVIFSLSGAVGPILGQNWGAGRYDRMRQTLKDSALFAIGWIAIAWLSLLLLRNALPALFGATGLTAELVSFFCLIAGPMWVFIGLLFVANAAFNNLGMPFYSTLFSWGRATLGTMPFSWLGALYAGPKGALVSIACGAVLFGIIGFAVAYRGISRLERSTGAALA